MKSTLLNRFIEFLSLELAVPADAIALATRDYEPMANQLPILLWQYGFVTLPQLDSMFDWLETESSASLSLDN